MKKNNCLLIASIFCLLILTKTCLAETGDTSTVKPPNKARLGLILGATGLTLGASYIYVQTAWWSGEKQSFRFDDGADYLYAKNVDKCAHFMGGLVTAEIMHDALKWAGVKENKAYFYSFLLGTTMHTFIELKDGFAKTYGFSIGDLGAGTVGSAIPYLKYKFPKLNALNFKFSYYQHDRFYYNQFKYADWLDDYMNHTYWVTASLNDWLPKGSKAEKIWPDFLCVAGGFGVDNTLNWYYKGVNFAENKGKGEYEYYLSLDIDWRKIIPQKTDGQKILARTLNYIKIPLPTVRLGPTTEFYWFFL
jgi:hypothetical protein